MSEPAVTVRHDAAAARYEAVLDGTVVGHLAYREEAGVLALVHTEVEPACEGRGIGSQLVAGALDEIRERRLRIVPVCPFVAWFVRRNPEYQELVARP